MLLAQVGNSDLIVPPAFTLRGVAKATGIRSTTASSPGSSWFHDTPMSTAFYGTTETSPAGPEDSLGPPSPAGIGPPLALRVNPVRGAAQPISARRTRPLRFGGTEMPTHCPLWQRAVVSGHGWRGVRATLTWLTANRRPESGRTRGAMALGAPSVVEAPYAPAACPEQGGPHWKTPSL